MNVPYKERYFEDYTVGEVCRLGEYLVTAEEIIDFARRYDPQPFHLDAKAGEASHFGGLVGSGWMTAAIMMRLLVDGYISPKASMGSPGMDDIRWFKPVRPGDRLRGQVTILQARRSESKPDRGLIQNQLQAINQHGEVVYQSNGWGMYKCRTPAPGTAPARQGK